MSDDQEKPPYPVVRLKGDRIVLRLGKEECELTVIDGMSDDAAHLAKTIQGRIQEVLAKRRRETMEKYVNAKS